MKANLSEALLQWYARHKRDLPWRRTTDPYKIWISEIMLQQTQVQTVIAYYQRWLKLFPTVQALAEAPEEQVLKAWQGLGYYRRAKNLKKAAEEIVAKHGGKFPGAIEEIRKLPGIGPYTAGAIASIAFNAPECALDVNVLRVGARVLLIKKDVAVASVREAIGDVVKEWIPKDRARWFNQALMELGALICLPSQPNCLSCPVREFCGAYKAGAQDRVPPKKSPKKRVKIVVVAGILKDPEGRVLIQKRPAGGLMENLWEFPGGKVEPKESLADALAREWKEELGVSIVAEHRIMTIRHAYTKFDVRLHVFSCRPRAGRPKALWAQEIRWVPVSRLDDYAYPSANAQIVRWLKQAEKKGMPPEKVLEKQPVAI